MTRHRAARQHAPAAVCGESREDPVLFDQGEGAHARRPQQDLGLAGWQALGHREERARPAQQARLGLHARAARLVQLLSE